MIEQNEERDREFREAVARAADERAAAYLRILEEHDAAPANAEAFRRIVARMFVDGVSWVLAAMTVETSSNLAALDQLGPVVDVHHMLSDVLYRAGVERGSNTPGGDRAGQDDPRES